MHQDAALPPASAALQQPELAPDAKLGGESGGAHGDSSPPCPRWSLEEQTKLSEMRLVLEAELAAVPQYLEVVGDRRLLRFLRGHNYDLKKATLMYRKFLKYRKDYRVDSIRDRICIYYRVFETER